MPSGCSFSSILHQKPPSSSSTETAGGSWAPASKSRGNCKFLGDQMRRADFLHLWIKRGSKSARRRSTLQPHHLQVQTCELGVASQVLSQSDKRTGAGALNPDVSTCLALESSEVQSQTP